MRSKILVGIILLLSACLGEEPTVSFEGQLNKQIKAIDDYLVANPVNPGQTIVRDASGIRMVIIEQGTGTFPPNPGNNLKMGYSGRQLASGSSIGSGEILFKLSDQGIIDGWKIAASLMTQGTQATVYIPGVWAYGSKGKGDIPPDANLVFEMNFMNVVPTSQQLDKIEDDGAVIDEYLSTNSITGVLTHESGIRYVVTQEGTGDIPKFYDGVKIKFKAKGLLDGEVYAEGAFEPSAEFSSRVVNYPHGAIAGLQLMAEGGKATFYVPSVLAYGLQGAPAGAIVVFEIELLDVITQ